MYINNEDSNSSQEKSSSMSKKGYDEFSAPISILSYPPLSYLLNSLLAGLNLLRECPMTTARSILLSDLGAVFSEFVEYFIKISDEVLAKGSKYFGNRTTSISIAINKKNATPNTSSDSISLSKLYAAAIAHEILPHVLLCFDIIYKTSKTSKLDNSKYQAIRVDKLFEAKALLSRESFAILEHNWNLLFKAKLLGDEAMQVSPIIPQAEISFLDANDSMAALHVEEEAKSVVHSQTILDAVAADEV